MNWSDYEVFLAACRTGSLGRTADALGVSLSTASRRLAVFEEDLGQPLFARTPAGLQLLPAAHALRPHAEAVERSALAGAAAVRSLDPIPRGEVRIGVPPDMLLLVLLPRVRPLLERFPEITLLFDSRSVAADLTRREADIAVRIARPPDSDELICRRIREVRFGFYARRDQVAALDEPADPRSYRWLGWAQETFGSPPLDAVSQGRYAARFHDPVSMRHAIQAGLGAGMLPVTFAESVPNLARIPIDAPPPMQLYLITHRAVRASPRVEAVWEALIEMLEPGDFEEDVQIVRAAAAAAYGWEP